MSWSPSRRYRPAFPPRCQRFPRRCAFTTVAIPGGCHLLPEQWRDRGRDIPCADLISKDAVVAASPSLDMLKTTLGVDVAGKRVLVRADLNVPVAGGRVSDATRLARLVPGLADLAKRGAKVIVLSHFGRPKAGPGDRIFAQACGRGSGRPARQGPPLSPPIVSDRPPPQLSARCAMAISRCLKTSAFIKAKKRTIRPSPPTWPNSATSSSAMPSHARTGLMHRPRRSRTCCRPTQVRC